MLHVRQVLGCKVLHACLARVVSCMQLCVTQSALSAHAASSPSLKTRIVITSASVHARWSYGCIGSRMYQQ